MKNVILLLLVFMTTAFQTNLYAQDAPVSAPKGQTGAASAEAKDNSLKWGIAMGGTAVLATAFGVVMYLASTDPTTYTHCLHCH